MNSSRSPSLTSASDAEVEADAPGPSLAVSPTRASTSAVTRSQSPSPSSASESETDDVEATFPSPILSPALATPRPSTTKWPFTSTSPTSPLLLPLHHQQITHFDTSPPLIPASSLPHEILLHILRLLPSSALPPALLVCKSWTQCGVELLYLKPHLPTERSLSLLLRTLTTPQEQQTFNYTSFIRRLNLSPIAPSITDAHLLQFHASQCFRIERLTLANCTKLSSAVLCEFIRGLERLVAVDLTDVEEVDDRVVETIAKAAEGLQGLNLSGCVKVSDTGVEAVAKRCPQLRRLKLRQLHLLTSTPILLLSLRCPLLLELDLIKCTSLNSSSLQSLLRHSSQLRELSLHSCAGISTEGFPPVKQLSLSEQWMAADGEEKVVDASGEELDAPIPLRYQPKLTLLEHLRYLDLTSLPSLTDDAVAGIVRWCPRIRNLIVAKCSNIGDEAVFAICGLGKWLHYLHMGHCSSITDRSVMKLARSCTRLRYIDLACCNLLTDMSVSELAQNVPRLKRIGLVRVSNLTDEAIYSLFARRTLERIHLSYCDNITVQAIHELLGSLDKLTHLSLTGVRAFLRADLQRWCRAPPKEFNSHQRASFCVYSGTGVQSLRRYLRHIAQDGIIPPPLELTPQTLDQLPTLIGGLAAGIGNNGHAQGHRRRPPNAAAAAVNHLGHPIPNNAGLFAQHPHPHVHHGFAVGTLPPGAAAGFPPNLSLQPGLAQRQFNPTGAVPTPAAHQRAGGAGPIGPGGRQVPIQFTGVPRIPTTNGAGGAAVGGGWTWDPNSNTGAYAGPVTSSAAAGQAGSAPAAIASPTLTAPTLVQCNAVTWAFSASAAGQAKHLGFFQISDTSRWLEIYDLPDAYTSLSTGTFTWTCDLPVGLSVGAMFYSTNSTGQIEANRSTTTPALTVQAGTSGGCIADNAGDVTSLILSYASSLDPAFTYTTCSAVAGGVVGGLALIGIVAGLLVFLKRRHDKHQAFLEGSMYGGQSEKYGPSHAGSAYGVPVGGNPMHTPPIGGYVPYDEYGRPLGQEYQDTPPIQSPAGRPMAAPGTLPEPMDADAEARSPAPATTVEGSDNGMTTPPLSPTHTSPFTPITEGEAARGTQGLDDPSSFAPARSRGNAAAQEPLDDPSTFERK
ncbi:F-box and leucine-rich repeat protein GRR1 [Pseudohyphozyma bogoriensis]|nr:F-box and leucine-rich repeat protein GRR1 [Pseudohyphozyma bogoriensis]